MKKKVFLLIVMALLLLAGVVAARVIARLKVFFETSPPSIVVTKAPPGVGLRPTTGEVLITDRENGLREVVIRAEQGTTRRELVRRSYEAGVREDRVTFEVPGKEAHLPVRPILLTVLAIDRGMWSNAQSLTLKLDVNYQKPKIEVLTYQHNITNGGTGFAVYRVFGGVKQSGVDVDGTRFDGYPAVKLDPTFEAYPDVYFSLFALPLQPPGKRSVTVFSHNAVGNSTSTRLPFRTIRKRSHETVTELNPDFVRSTVAELLPALAAEENAGSIPEARTPAELAGQFRRVNEDYRRSVEARVMALFAESADRRLWEGAFIRPAAGATRVPFAEQRVFRFKGNDAGSSMSMGIDIAAGSRSVVRAANNGTVRFAGELPLYGKTVIVDHGFGLASLYANLSAVDCRVGEEVAIGKPIGTAGRSGLTFAEQLHFEIRVRGVPVRPVEWWDGHWIKDHVTQVLRGVKQRLEVEGRILQD